MWTKELIQEMFPTGQLPTYHEPARILLHSNYDIVTAEESEMARDMIHKLIQHVWTKEGEKKINILYNVYPFPSINGDHCLSVYGGKMVQNWLQLQKNEELNDDLKYFRHQPAQEEKQEDNNARFNYTGL